jgi:hypothetical protein
MKTHTYSILAVMAGVAKLAQGQNPSQNEFHAIKELLHSHYQGACEQHVVGLAAPVTTVQCTNPGGTAYLQAAGDPPGAKPQFLKVCSIGSEGATSCNKIRFRGNAETDIERATELLNGSLPRTVTDYAALVEFLNQEFGGSCQTSTSSGMITNTTVACTRPGGNATLTATSGDAYPPQIVPESLTACMFGSYMEPACKTIALTGVKNQDLKLSKKLLTSNLSSEYQQLVAVLYMKYDQQTECKTSFITLPPAPTEETIACTMPGSNATFTAEQASGQATPVAKSLQVCSLGSYENARCQNIDFIGKVNRDVKAAKFILGIDDDEEEDAPQQ